MTSTKSTLILLFALFNSFLVTHLPAARAAETFSGLIGVGTWATQAEFKDIQVTHDGKTLFSSDFSKDSAGWKMLSGTWQVVDGALRQTSNDEGARAIIGQADWNDYTLSLKARKIAGNEGFLICFGLDRAHERDRSWWNVGGWGNTAHAFQLPGVSDERVAGQIETGRWYDIRIELDGNSIRAFLDGKLIQTATRSPAEREFGHALIPDMLADPSVVEFDGTFYCYATTDGEGHGLSTSGLPVVWTSKDFANWSFNGSIFDGNYDAKYWAPSAPIKKDGRYYLFPTLNNRITALVSDSLLGPFTTLDGRPITRNSGWQQFPIPAGHPIDAEILRDDDGSYYMYWSQRFAGKLKPDFSGFDGKVVPITTRRRGYSEGPCVFKRNGIYYYLYTLGGAENYQYACMMSRKSPLGPWEAPEQDIIATTNARQGVHGPGHGCFFQPAGSDQWYFIHLEFGRGGTNRSIFASAMNFNADGTIQPIQLSLKGVGALRRDPRYDKPNLSLAKHAVASSTRPEMRIMPEADRSLNRIEQFLPENALDGSNGSRWMAQSDDARASFTLDLGQPCDVTRTELYFVRPTAGHAYRMEYSTDNKTWQPYGGHEQLKIQSPHVDEKPVRARYFKLTILQGTAGLWEFRVY